MLEARRRARRYLHLERVFVHALFEEEVVAFAFVLKDERHAHVVFAAVEGGHVLAALSFGPKRR